MRLRSLVVVLGSVLSACSRNPPPLRVALPAASHDAAVTNAPTGPVVVTIVVDQFAGWIASERVPLLPADGGFARLRREGLYVKDMRYAHAVTDTAPGHSALYTGLPPSETGVIGNEMLDENGKRVSILLHQGESSLALLDGRPHSRGGPVMTLADRLIAVDPDALVISLSLKDRGALFAAGRHPTLAIWFDTKRAQFTNAAGLAKFGDRDAVQAKMTGTWAPLDREWVRARAVVTRGGEGEGDAGGLGVGDAHDLGHVGPADLGYAFRATPMADEMLFAMAEEILKSTAGKAPSHTLFALSLSANDYIGHVFGPDSWEAWDEIRRIDASLASFFKALDDRYGPHGYSVVLTADHGTTNMKEAAALARARPWCAQRDGSVQHDAWERACGAVWRVLPDDMAKTLNKAAASIVKEGAVADVLDPYVILSDRALALPSEARARLDGVLTKALHAIPGVKDVFDVRKLPHPCPPETDESEAALVCRSYAPWLSGERGEFYVVTEPGSYFDPRVVSEKGTSHGSPRLYDRSVPLFVRRADGKGAGEVTETPASYRRFSATVAELLHIPWSE